jgi:outer membrane protein OmpA-like peptidoglycan-associated protein
MILTLDAKRRLTLPASLVSAQPGDNFPKRLKSIRSLMSIGALLIGGYAAAADPPDLVGSKDSPLVSRYAGSSLVAYADINFDQETLPLTNQIEDDHFVKGETVEGKITRLVYLAPPGKTGLEVTRNYQLALTKAGLTVRFSCEKDKCSDGSSRIQQPFVGYANGMKQLPSYGGFEDLGFVVLNDGVSPHYFWGVLPVDGRPVYVSVFTNDVNAPDDSPLKGRVGTFIEIVEPKPMEANKVSVDATAIGAGVANAGKIALYGIFFDTNKADLKPESKEQLSEIGKFLAMNKAIKVIVVGHTDNVGSIEANQALSQQRASAVAAALINNYQVAPGRILAKGVGNLCPVASNASEEGRAKNRRVELVQQ